MSGKRRLDSDLRGLQIADLADHHDIGVLAQERAKDVREVQPICGFTWIWLTPSSWYSIGSSTVKMFLSGVFSRIRLV